MIASLRGTVLAVRENTCIVDVNGVGYAVNVTPAHKFSVTIGAEHTFLTSLIVREDSLTLFGFENPESLELFEQLLSVSGVGPRSALAVLAEMSPAEILTAVVNEDDSAFKKVSGVGPKTAKLIIVQLAGKLTALADSETISHAAQTVSPISLSVVQALVGLGWNEKVAREAVDSLDSSSPAATTASILKEALVSLARNS
ncbi:Holliday junction branch migration protein RuvA [Aurantimicrobium minutum]|uniref:Holliday junction branch migration protein RuvA n=1 Tax=Aurantimicrobium minutum TaxID=708131 RepID=UPI002474E09F|nr:Holliday junction branch migration protein RuvA [Aurantimicrobium minutum]MDH6422556.1 Holliday junction DNA helicase RuvA [Aurantimicrobium minutum]